jgi:plastocyanin
MRFRFHFPLLLLVLALAAACSQPGSTPSPTAPGASLAEKNNSPLSATVRFGNDTVGSPFPPPSGHDQSGHGRDNLIPRTVVIDQGGTVTFVIGGPVHQVAIYKDGTTPEQVGLAGLAPKAGCGPAPYIPGTNDPNFIKVLGQPPCAGGPTTVSQKFDNPGRYLVICSFLPHFNVGMYGWVEVRAKP